MILNFLLKILINWQGSWTGVFFLHRAFICAPLYVFLKISEDNIKFKLNKNIFYLIYFSVFI